MATSYGATDDRAVNNSNINSEHVQDEVANHTPRNNAHFHDTACLFIVVAQVALYLLLNVAPYINSTTFNTAKYNAAVHICAVVIYCTSCVAMAIFLVRCIRAFRTNLARSGDNERTTVYSNETPRESSCIRNFVLTALFLGSVVQIIASSVLSTDSDNASSLLIALKIFFCIFQLLLVICCNRRRTNTNRFNLYLLTFIIAGNACVFVDFVIFSIKSHGDVEFFDELYVFRLHFTVFSLVMLYNTFSTDESSNSINRSQVEFRNIEPVQRESTSPMRRTRFRIMKHYVTATVRFICYNSLYFSLLYCIFLLSVNIAEKENYSKSNGSISNHTDTLTIYDTVETACVYVYNHTDTLTIYDTVETACVYVYSVVILVVLIFAGLEKSDARISSADKFMLFVSLTAFIVLHLVEMVIDGNYLHNLPRPIPKGDLADYILFAIFENLGLFCQTAFVLKVSGLRLVSPLTLSQMFIRGTVVFLCVFNFEKWIHDSFFFPKDYSIFVDTSETVNAWYGFASPFLAMSNFHRLFSAVLLYESLLSFPRE